LTLLSKTCIITIKDHTLKHIWANIKVKLLNTWEQLKVEWQHIKDIVKALRQELRIPENHDLRIFFFVIAYILLSLVGMYNFAHLLAFVYIIMLLERKFHGN
jgi:hypothetical protein